MVNGLSKPLRLRTRKLIKVSRPPVEKLEFLSEKDPKIFPESNVSPIKLCRGAYCVSTIEQELVGATKKRHPVLDFYPHVLPQ